MKVPSQSTWTFLKKKRKRPWCSFRHKKAQLNLDSDNEILYNTKFAVKRGSVTRIFQCLNQAHSHGGKENELVASLGHKARVSLSTAPSNSPQRPRVFTIWLWLLRLNPCKHPGTLARFGSRCHQGEWLGERETIWSFQLHHLKAAYPWTASFP